MSEKSQKKELKLLVLFVFPALIFYSLFVIIPAITGIGYSFTNWTGLNPNFQFVGLKNYIDALTKDKNFLNSVMFTIKYVVVMVVTSNLIALSLAVLIDSKTKSSNFFRTVFFMPNMISFIIGAYIWQFIFKRVIGELAILPGLSFLSQSWLGDPKFSFWAIIMMSLWTSVGYIMVIYIAALQGVPNELKEAARVDGATAFQVIRKVTFPMIMHAVTINVFLVLNGSFKAFDQIYGLTGGGPGRTTQVMSMNVYEEAFSSYFRYGYANAKAIILFLFILIITLIQLKITSSREVKA